jgi:PAS domain S-box-containing protein
MKIPFTPQLLGDLIEKGYTYVLASSEVDVSSEQATNILLKPVRSKPQLSNLPESFETFYKITREPMQLACGVDGVLVELDYETSNDNITSQDIFDDSYFRMSEEFFEMVLNSLEDYAVFTTDKNGDVNSWNSGAEHVLGYAKTDIIGLNSSIFFTPEDIKKDAPNHELEAAIEKGRAIDERYHVRKDGSRFWGSGLVFPLHDEEGNHRGFTKIMRNLRERENAEAEGPEA